MIADQYLICLLIYAMYIKTIQSQTIDYQTPFSNFPAISAHIAKHDGRNVNLP